MLCRPSKKKKRCEGKGRAGENSREGRCLRDGRSWEREGRVKERDK